jgi:hypothetical protein
MRLRPLGRLAQALARGKALLVLRISVRVVAGPRVALRFVQVLAGLHFMRFSRAAARGWRACQATSS